MTPWLADAVERLRAVDSSPHFFLWDAGFGLIARRRAADKRWPEVGEPNLLYLPAPYHPMEAMAAGTLGGVRHGDPNEPQRGVQVIERVRRKSTTEAFHELGIYLGLDAVKSLVLAHLLTPFDVGDEGEKLRRMRIGLFLRIGFSERAARRAWTSVGKLKLKDEFWKVVNSGDY